MGSLFSSRLLRLAAFAAAVGLAACSSGDDAGEVQDAASPTASLFAGNASDETIDREVATPMSNITANATPLASNHPNSIQPETTLSISADGYVKREPDIAFLMAGVDSEAGTAEAAMAQNAEAMNGVFEALERAGVARKDMQTSNFSLQPQYDYSNRRDGQPPRLTGYRASNQLSVRVRNLDTLGETMDTLVSAGGNTFSGLRFALDDDRDAKNEARRLAMAEALSRAQLYAAASGYEVARIVTLSESGGYQPQPMMQARAMAIESADMGTPVAGGEVGYSITVNVVFELRQPEDQ
ncbi:MAG: SIMPL domain-containing protein [Pseudomonadota bacterium]